MCSVRYPISLPELCVLLEPGVIAFFDKLVAVVIPDPLLEVPNFATQMLGFGRRTSCSNSLCDFCIAMSRALWYIMHCSAAWKYFPLAENGKGHRRLYYDSTGST
jgi:hypothetical protein